MLRLNGWNAAQSNPGAFMYGDHSPVYGYTWVRDGYLGQVLGSAEVAGWGSAVQVHPCAVCGDPVNLASGVLLEAVTDVSVPGRVGRGPGLVVSRSYSSFQPVAGPFGFGWSFSYGARLQLSGSGVGATAVLVDGSGSSSAAFVRQGDGSWVAPGRVLASLSQAADGSFTVSRSGVGGSLAGWRFSSAGDLVAVVDAAGVAATVASVPGVPGRVGSVTDPAGRSVVFSWTSTAVGSSPGSPRIASVTDSAGRVTSYGYSSAGDLTSVTDPAGRVTRYGYDGSHQLTRWVDGNGGVTVNTFTAGRVTKQVDPAGLVTRYAYAGDPATSSGSVTTVTDPHGLVMTQSYKNWQLSSVTHAVGTGGASTSRIVRDPGTLRPVVQVDPTGAVTVTGYDVRGNVTSSTDPTGRLTRYTYDSMDHLVSVTSPSGVVASSSYVGASNQVTPYLQWSRVSGGALTSTTTYGYADPAHPGDVTGVTDPDGRVASLTYDSFGNVATSSVVDAARGVTSTSGSGYTIDGRLVCAVSGQQYAGGVR